jgi:hypothetical protein
MGVYESWTRTESRCSGDLVPIIVEMRRYSRCFLNEIRSRAQFSFIIFGACFNQSIDDDRLRYVN